MARNLSTRVFIADHDRDTREIFGAILRHAGFAVDAPADAHTACAHLLGNPPSVLIVALELPGSMR